PAGPALAEQSDSVAAHPTRRGDCAAAELAIAAGSAVADEPGVTANTGKPAVNVTQTAGTTGPAIAEHAAQA
ncbi:hypothetical protein, partial [Mycobacterium tuberculosis]|uniref:hypothetical protein n=1 Tax=Mycobacterium tuberculosis TaxID=1773 RepID=UPI002234F689